MKNIYYMFFLTILMITSCQKENESFDNKEHLIEKNKSLDQEYSWNSDDSNNKFGEVLYVPVYSSIYHQNEKTFDLTATLSIHNIDINSKLTVAKVNYYNSNGEFVQSFIKKEFILNPLQSKQFIIKETDISGGTAAKFLIQWYSEEKVLKPITEAVMISTSSQQGISFKTDSRVINSIGY